MEGIMEKYNFTFHFHSNEFLTQGLKGNEDFAEVAKQYDAVVIDTKYPHIETMPERGLVWFADGDEKDFDLHIVTPLIRVHKEKIWQKIRVLVIGDSNTFMKLAPYINTITVHGKLSCAEIDKYTDFIAKYTRENDEQLQESSSHRVRVRRNGQLETIFNMMIPEPWIIDHVYAMDWNFNFVPETTTTICSGSVLLNPMFGGYTLGSVLESAKPSTHYSLDLGKKYALEKLLSQAQQNAGAIFAYTEHTQLTIPPLYDLRPHHLRVKKYAE